VNGRERYLDEEKQKLGDRAELLYENPEEV
jgi:hypothetical protein